LAAASPVNSNSGSVSRILVSSRLASPEGR